MYIYIYILYMSIFIYSAIEIFPKLDDVEISRNLFYLRVKEYGFPVSIGRM